MGWGFPALTPAPLWRALGWTPTLFGIPPPPPPPQAPLDIPTQLLSSGKIHAQMLRILETRTQISPGLENEELTTTTSTVCDSHLLQQCLSFLPIGASGSRHTSLPLLLSVTLENTREHTPLDAPSVCAEACSSQTLTWQWLCCRWGFRGRLWGFSGALRRRVGSLDTDTSPGQRCRPTAWLQTSRNRITVRLRQFSEQTEISWAWMFTSLKQCLEQTQNFILLFFVL